MKINKIGIYKSLNKFHHNGAFIYYEYADKMISDLSNKTKTNPTFGNIKALLFSINKLGATHTSNVNINKYSKVIYENRNKIFKMIKNGETKVVNLILETYTKNNDYNVSLISKFCCKCNERCFPISDSKVIKFLVDANKKLHFFTKKKISAIKLHENYDLFVEVINEFVKENKLQKFKYRELDLAIGTSTK